MVIAPPLRCLEKAMTSWRNSRYLSAIFLQENSLALAFLACCPAEDELRAARMEDAMLAGLSLLVKNCSSPTIHRSRAESRPTIGRPQLMASRKTFPKGSSVAR